ncbi:aminotransferase class V-fold PLP-dependent enzyme [Clostridium tarantellae]|uniref:cysteine desulfurase n=1 Tax=Clostridium tarantellae TaxID=39493 RepID=A0A6I1MNE0_9CLOT|nr:aminotransferase class V-fold PLP-dependent enzyme [Clostridium tarantellae]MPQ43772.1 aminotransferase class V-fold PLP-dependent enzyme [Clostridium tarantellae]
MQKIYFDNAATSYPKPKEVIDSMMNYMINYGGSANRGSSSISLHSNRLVYECRNELSNFFNFKKCENVIFTNNITSSINMLLLGIIKPNWHIITTSMEHNSVIRPLINISNTLENVSLDIINCDKLGFISINDIKNKIKSNTKLIILSHASNLVGSIQPIKDIGKLCKEKNIFLILDSAQTAGTIPIDIKALNLNALAFTGHKSLLGPQGIGGFIIDDSLNEICNPIFLGGTGSNSSLLIPPSTLPDKFECGTLNTPGIVGLLEGIKFINKTGIKNIKEKEEYLCKKALEELLNMPNIKIYGTFDETKRTSTISFNINNIDPSEIGYLLDSEYNITCRTGLHCTPLAHKTVGSYPNGSIRISLGYFNTINEIRYFIDSIYKITNKAIN